ncbi:hypothetical protein B6U90_06680 [Thermoplasmatales archaeon ex4484_6]|nr:MAG: hypothetical protein B6U90_06680 [Thermoplasmatales archaeon ex4484_6]RLF67903.1 MAG: hypothetical protein DRN57_05140 [Thermoplasmata archaeon]
MERIRKISTGVEGLDRMLDGGLIAGRPYSVIGGPGSGKSIMGWQFLRQGVANGENTMYITLDEPHYEIRANMDQIGLDDPSIRIMDLSPEDMFHEGEVSSLNFLERELPVQIEKLRPLRVVLDSTTSIRALEKDEVNARRRILSLMKLLSERGGADPSHPPITSLLLTEDDGRAVPVESFLARGVIRLVNSIVRGSRVRAVLIEKMRGSPFDDHMRPLRIGQGGMRVADTDTLITSPEKV